MINSLYFRMTFVHYLGMVLLLANAAFFTNNLIGQIVQIVVAIVILIHELDENKNGRKLINVISSSITAARKGEQIDFNTSMASEFNVFQNIVTQIQQEHLDMVQDNMLIEDAQSVMQKVSNGCYGFYITKEAQNKHLNILKDSINNMIKNSKTNIKHINSILEEYAHLNYSNKLTMDNIEKDSVFELLITDINKLRDAVTKMLVEDKQNGLTLQENSNSLFSYMDSLNQSSTEAATSLKETSIALEKITTNISNNTENVVNMAQFASQVTSSANEGEKLATQTTTAMDEINNEVTAINEAISVIDQIAFQTNILSLNAAVEAATAGEAGKGFAVVAQEVRNLASRSAEAANEIKSLVENATNKANNGKIISDKMIEGYNGLNENISKTIELISSVELASKEQLQGIEQINHAVTTLDEQTQQNATVANKTKELAIQTQQIAQTVINSANEKEFEGKNDIQPTKTNTTQDNQLNNITSTNNKSSVKTNHNINNTPTTPKEHIQVKSTPTPAIQPKEILPTIEPISSNNQDDDEWETF